MILSTNIILSGSVQNPDSIAIRNKDTIDISLTEFDVSASNMPVKGNYITNIITIHPTVTGSLDVAELYFTPIYAEKINYEQWKVNVNKRFSELEAR